MATQSVIIKKSHPDVKSRRDAERIAKQFGAVKTSRETATSFRFRQRSPEDFSAMRTKRVGKHVSIVTGRLKKGR